MKGEEMSAKVMTAAMAALLAGMVLADARDFAIVKDGRPCAAFVIPDGLDKKSAQRVADDLVSFNDHFRQVTGTELATNGIASAKIEIVLHPITNLLTRYDWRIDYPDAKTMRIEATTSSLYNALRQIFEEGCDARFLGTEECMFQFEPRKDVAMKAETKVSSPNGFRLFRNLYSMRGHEREMGLDSDRLFQFNHGLPVYALPCDRFNREGWPAEIMPIQKGKRLKKPRNLYSGWQPCYSHPRTAEVAVETARGYLKKHPGALSISLAVNDNGGYCECEACRALDKDAEPSVLTNDKGNHSGSYYTFVNRVAAELEKDHPDVKIGVLAYIGTIMPPKFPVHHNVVPVLTFDLLSAAQEEATFQAQHDVMRRWSESCDCIGLWDYCWGRNYVFPRVNFGKRAERMRFFHRHHGESYFGENRTPDAADGPKAYLTARLLEDAEADPEAILNEWYVRFAGPAAAPVLKSVFDRCVAYWTSESMRRSPYYKGRGWVFQGGGAVHLYALQPGCTRGLVQDVKRVVELARTPGEKKRAETLLRHFEMVDCHPSLRGFGYCESESGEFASAERAAEAVNATVDRLDELLGEFARSSAYFKNPDFRPAANPENRAYARTIVFSLAQLMSDLVSRATAFADDVRVQAALKRLADAEGVPEQVRKLARSTGGAVENLFADPGFAKPLPKGAVTTTLEYEITDEVLYKGEKTLKVWPGRYEGEPNPGDIVLSNVPMIEFRHKFAPGVWKSSVSIMTPSAGKGMDAQLWKTKGETGHCDWAFVSYTPLNPGQWRTFTRVNDVSGKADGLSIYIRTTEDFKPDECIYIGGIEFSKGE